MRCSARWAWASSRTAPPRRSPADSCSGPRSPPRSPRGPVCSCSTSPPPCWTPRAWPRCGAPSTPRRIRPAARCCWSSTAWTNGRGSRAWTGSPRGPWRWTAPAGCSPTGRRGRCSPPTDPSCGSRGAGCRARSRSGSAPPSPSGPSPCPWRPRRLARRCCCISVTRRSARPMRPVGAMMPCSPARTSRSAPGVCSRSSAATAPGSPRCSGPSPGWTRCAPGRSRARRRASCSSGPSPSSSPTRSRTSSPRAAPRRTCGARCLSASTSPTTRRRAPTASPAGSSAASPSARCCSPTGPCSWPTSPATAWTAPRRRLSSPSCGRRPMRDAAWS